MITRPYAKFFVSAQFWVMVFLLAFVCMPLIYPVKFPVQFWVKQTFDFAIWSGVFFFSGYVLAPKVIFKGQILLSIIIVILIMIGVVWVDNQLDKLLHMQEAMDKTFGTKQHSTPHLGNFIAVVVTLLLLGMGTISAVVQRFQADRLKEQVLQQEKIVSELSFLKTQINPHFFFNVLNTIYALIGSKNTDTAQESVYTLSHMMRYVLYDTKHDHTTLAKEIAFIDDYIKLMRLRLPDAVQVIFEKPLTQANAELSPMLFLPYIENAFKHGVSSVHPSYIYIELKQAGNELLFEIRNSLFEQQPDNKEESNGIGLKNTQRRLDLLYPGKHLLQVEKDDTAREFVVKLKLQLQ
ncbi:sensor histidine kinase [Mucilaginibacter conchicola]|uniref:Sensor histidine kinase n=1 Tax=Mucilaginibacter conchicola TaxID=2303333 RepID=A0A372NVX6_9SPHI|nr:histidine kinase [Mucilaginibacter conchicola]RFZ94021.1 sensor histidine kinase [Mucilaginibacter conchicola]